MEDSETVTPEDRARVLSFLGPAATKEQRRAIVRSITPPPYNFGQLGQQRNFYNPEFDANLTDFMHWAGADEFKFRFAWWGFYDGIYDYLDEQWDDRIRKYRTRFSESDNPGGESYKFNDQYKNPRSIYGHRTASTSSTSTTRTARSSSASAARRSRGASRTRSRCSTSRTRST
jgi:hypothetical protein